MGLLAEESMAQGFEEMNWMDLENKEKRPDSERPSVELHGNFIAVCRALHTIMQSIVAVDLECEFEWEEFCNELRKEGMSQDRWSQPVHSKLAEALRMTGFSKEDWELSLPYKNGMVTYSPEINDPDLASQFEKLPNLTDAQMNLEERIRDYYREDMKKFLGA